VTISHVKGTNWQIRFVCFDRRHHRGRRHALLPHVLGGGVAVGQLSDRANGGWRIAIGKLAGQNNPALSILSIKVELFSEFLSPIGSGINPPIVEYNVVWLTLLAFQSARNDGRTTILLVQACEVTIRRVRILMAHFAWPGSSSHLNNSQPISRVLMTKPQKLYCAV
jgi:hypothetical protein